MHQGESKERLDLQRSFARTDGYRLNTPLVYSSFLSQRWSARVYLKMEQMQTIGAFKIRGAANFILQLDTETLSKGVVTHSSGNHAQAVAYMAKKLGVKAFIVMPENANKKKISLARKWGAEISFCAPTIEARISTAEELSKEHKATMVPPFDHKWIIQGQATAAMEMLLERPELDVLCAPLGGGGLLAGTALASKYFGEDITVYGAEPTQAADGYTGFKSGIRETSVKAHTIADGLRTTVGIAPFEVIKENVNDIFLADEALIVPWMYKIWEETKMIIEPSCAVPFAALDGKKELLKNRTIGIIITGGNVDMNELPDYSVLPE